jgi:hypothetical protein
LLSELKSAKTDLNIEVIGINQTGYDVFNPLIFSSSRLPWLQDTARDEVWARWQVTWRDVFILDSENRVYAVYNLTEHNLAIPDNREALKHLFLQAATVSDSDQDGLPDDWELRFLGGLSAKANEDPDSDGVDNFTEFLFGTDSANPKSRSALQPELVSKGQERYLSVTFRRRAGSMFDYSIETSTDLRIWNPASAVESQSPRNLFDGTGTSEIRTTFTNPASNPPQGFLRARAVPRPRP